MRSPLLRLVALLLSFTLLAAACGDDDPIESSDAGEESSDEDMADDEGPGTIVDVAVGAGSFDILVAAVIEAGLADTLSGDGPFTVFAPTDDAFVAALGALGLTAEELLANPALAEILTYHVVAGEVDAATAISLDGQSAATVQGEEIAISVVDGNVVINDSATVVAADVAASNGIIHVIDAVLLPPSIAEVLLGDDMADEEAADEEAAVEEADPGTIVDVAVAAGSFETLVAAVQAAGLVETLSGEGPFTVFAPTDDAFAAALDVLGLTAEELLADTDTLTAVLTYHVIAGEVDAATAISLDGQSAATVNGAEIAISVVDGNVVINDSATVVAADVAASNGIIHVIDAVLLPAS
ncbi:MAG: fasciclin domain-containing protein [Acidimicrobiales bacterium]|nr:fasciclin domain-containing protein [Acidimicrobiales bacterium]